MAQDTAQQGLRIAIEGCVSAFQELDSWGINMLQGHGVLNSIYASVAKAAKMKQWDGVDLVIIGGDFQVGRE
jgi:lariat debranching enzyme